MAPAAVPLAKLLGLLIKTLAKPVAKQVKHQFVKQPITRSALIWVGQTTHAVTTRMTIWSSGYKVRSISKLEEEAALSRGADILSETFIFSVSTGILLYEYNRSSAKEKKKEEARLQKIRDDATRLQEKLNSLDKRLVSLEDYAKANRRSIVLGIGLGANGGYVEPDADEVVPIDDEESESESKTANQPNSPSVKNSSNTSQKSW
eukprot:CAMPEP_0172325674 /NCGR_PEP_ID=MMETSP1058-20130122/54513_1 /TAXON_ID=83371 /ORGANISM="Detonula confervacea, Strain CCMP 353" /LENGTH=204 /DNA_ID=CAMNT_0013042267 /DNA_START=68 /DNA_END=679 /DNA_ORIENTATION=-